MCKSAQTFHEIFSEFQRTFRISLRAILRWHNSRFQIEKFAWKWLIVEKVSKCWFQMCRSSDEKKQFFIVFDGSTLSGPFRRCTGCCQRFRFREGSRKDPVRLRQRSRTWRSRSPLSTRLPVCESSRRKCFCKGFGMSSEIYTSLFDF